MKANQLEEDVIYVSDIADDHDYYMMYDDEVRAFHIVYNREGMSMEMAKKNKMRDYYELFHADFTPIEVVLAPADLQQNDIVYVKNTNDKKWNHRVFHSVAQYGHCPYCVYEHDMNHFGKYEQIRIPYSRKIVERKNRYAGV